MEVITQSGKIQEVLVNRGGSGYNTPPTLILKGNGKYAKLTPLISSGSITEIKVLNGGIEYDETTTIEVEAAGKTCRLYANLEKWTVNLFHKY